MKQREKLTNKHLKILTGINALNTGVYWIVR